MATATLIPLSEYLRTTYRPDRDFLAGILQERNMGEQPHARIQGFFCALFNENRRLWQVRVLPEQRIQTSADRFRIADICVLRSSDPKDPIIHFPPLLCIEILSKDDTLGDLQLRVNDYAGLGVRHIWAVDPWKRLAYVASTRGFVQPEDNILRIPDTPIQIDLPTLFAELDGD